MRYEPKALGHHSASLGLCISSESGFPIQEVALQVRGAAWGCTTGSVNSPFPTPLLPHPPFSCELFGAASAAEGVLGAPLRAGAKYWHAFGA